MELQGINVQAWTHLDGYVAPGLLMINGWMAYGESMRLMFMQAIDKHKGIYK
jgi:hypothetical protein